MVTLVSEKVSSLDPVNIVAKKKGKERRKESELLSFIVAQAGGDRAIQSLIRHEWFVC